MTQQNTAIKDDVLSEVRKHVKFNLVLDSRKFFDTFSWSDEQIIKNFHNIDIENLHKFSSRRLFKIFAANDSSFSSSLDTHVRMLSDRYRATAYKDNKSLFADGQAFIDGLLERINYKDFSMGFVESNTIHDQVSKIGRNMLTSDNAAGALWVALTDKFEVDKFQVIDCDRIYFKNRLGYIHDYRLHSGQNVGMNEFNDPFSKKPKRYIPFCYNKGHKISLDYPNLIWQPIDADAGDVVGNNPLRSGLRVVFTKMRFLEDLRRVLRNQAWPKIKVVMDQEATIKMAPPEVKQNPAKLIDFLNAYLSKVKDQLTGIEADQDIVVYNTISDIGFLESSNKKFDFKPVLSMLDSELIASHKAPPSTVGKGGMTKTGEGLASAELVIFRRSIIAMRRVIEALYSRAFTLALRLSGRQGFVKFRLNEFTLRPYEEAAQFDSIRQDTILSAWVNGAIGDEEKNRRIRHLHGLDGPAPVDARVREAVTPATNRETERGPIAEEKKETGRQETRRQQKTGNNRKS
jgi:hypothetical protein